ncbi:recombinase family protein [Spirillospora sp. NPDC047418]
MGWSIAGAARLFRSVADILALRPVLIRRGLHLCVESGPLSGTDLAADHPGTKMMVNVLASVLEFQRDMISETTRQGVAAAESSGKTLGAPPPSMTARPPRSSPPTPKAPPSRPRHHVAPRPSAASSRRRCGCCRPVRSRSTSPVLVT